METSAVHTALTEGTFSSMQQNLQPPVTLQHLPPPATLGQSPSSVLLVHLGGSAGIAGGLIKVSPANTTTTATTLLSTSLSSEKIAGMATR